MVIFRNALIANAHDLLASGINANLFCVEQPSAEHWPAWTKLLTEFAKAHATVGALERNTLLFVLHDAQMMPPNENLIAASYLHDFTRPEDCFFHACQCSAGTGARSLEEEVRIHVCSELALWDFELCSYLMGLSLDAVLQPFDALCAYARSSGDDGLDVSKRYQPCRNSNNGSTPDQTHAVILALKEDRVELCRRVWRGQVQVLFPLIEDQRCKLLDLIRSKFPAVLGDGDSVDETLEIGPLVRFMRHYGKCPRELLALAGRLKKMRDKIAHLQVCTIEDTPTRAELIE